jgi:hypothetical protein
MEIILGQFSDGKRCILNIKNISKIETLRRLTGICESLNTVRA